MDLARRLIVDEEGNDSIEYALLAAFIAAVIVGTVTAIGGTLNGVFGRLAEAFPG